MANPEPPGRREQHKAATRRSLQDAARRKFEEHGYARTTVRDIAAAAGVTERTFFRYFPSKEDLVLGEILDMIPVFQDHVRGRPAEESPYTAVLNVTLALAAGPDGRLNVLFSGPPRRFTKPKGQFSVLGQFEDGIADALADRLGGDGGAADSALRAAVLARASVGAMRSALTAYAARPEPDQTFDSAAELLRTAFAFLQE